MDYRYSDPRMFSWKMMYKGEDSLSAVLRVKTKYNLVKVKKGVRNYIPFLLNASKGKFVCVLQDNNYGQNHVVGINCESSPTLIWDCVERNAMELTQRNLDCCTKQGMVCIAIQCIGELKRK